MLKSSMYRSLLLLLISVTPICAQEPTAPPAPPDKGLSHGSGATVLEQPSTPPANAKNGYLLSPNPDAAVLPKPSVKLDPIGVPRVGCRTDSRQNVQPDYDSRVPA